VKTSGDGDLMRGMMRANRVTSYRFLLGTCASVDEEYKLEGDMLRVAHKDTYQTSAIKILLGLTAFLELEWAWLMKIDDDVLVSFFSLHERLRSYPCSLTLKRPLWWGTFRRGKPHYSGSWKVNKNAVQGLLVRGEYPFFAIGFGHVLNRRAVEAVAANRSHWFYFVNKSSVWMEDVAFGLWLQHLPGLCLLSDPWFVKKAPCDDPRAIAVLDGVFAPQQKSLCHAHGHALETKKIFCGTTTDMLDRESLTWA
jgi:hypothetical protein